jgi:hypothetical protein
MLGRFVRFFLLSNEQEVRRKKENCYYRKEGVLERERKRAFSYFITIFLSLRYHPHESMIDLQENQSQDILYCFPRKMNEKKKKTYSL